jgi:hypothetical protein
MRRDGILVFAIGAEYARFAYGLYLSAKAQDVEVAIAVDEGAKPYLRDKGLTPIEVPVPNKLVHPFWYEQFAYDLTPFDTTLKMDADCVLHAGVNMTHIFDRIRQGMCTGIPYDLQGDLRLETAYRQYEDSVGLPTVYSTMFGFNKNNEAYLFYQHIKMFVRHWGSHYLPMTVGKQMTTDTLYSMAWLACHSERSVLGGLPFHHVKSATMNWPNNQREDWTQDTPHHLDDDGRLYINGIAVFAPCHYYDKNFMSTAMIARLERLCSLSST